MRTRPISATRVLSSSLSLTFVLTLGLAACSKDPESPPVGVDAAVELDAGVEDAGVGDDAGAPDAGAPDAGTSGFGVIAGPCGRLLGELDEPTPSFFQTRLDFMDDQFDDPAERPLLTPGASEILMDGTAGGSSGLSEAFAFEVLARCEGATLVKSETEIVYDPPSSKKTDILVSIDGIKVGVSVTRAVSFPRESPYTAENVAFIERKLDDILISSANVVEADAWVKQVLLVVAYGDMHAEVVRTFWESLDAETRADTVLYVVVTDGEDAPIY